MRSDEQATLAEFIELIRGTTYKGNMVGLPGPALLGLGAIQPGGGFREADFKTYGGECPAKLILGPGDLFASLKGATKDGEMIGSVARVPTSVLKGRLTQDTVKLDFRKGNPSLEQYIYWLLQSPHCRAYCASHATGSAVVGLSREDFLSYPVPPLTEQRAQCVDLLEDIEQLIRILRETNVTFEAIAQALFKSWFVDFDPVRAKAEGREPESMDAATAALFPSEFGDSELGPIPKGWRVTNVGAVAELIKGCSYKGAGLSDTEGAYMFNLGCFNAKRMFATENIKRYTESYRERQSVAEGDLIMANTDMTQQREILGRALFVPAGCEPAFVSHHVFKVAIRRSNADEWRRLLFFSFQQPAFRERAVGHATGTTVLALARDSAEKCPIIEPDEKVHTAFDAAISPLLAQIANNLDRARNLEGIRDSLLPRLISGKLRLPEAKTMLKEVIA